MPEQKSEVYLYNDLPDTINALLDFDERTNRKRCSFFIYRYDFSFRKGKMKFKKTREIK